MPSVITPIIDTAIGLVVVYITFSVLASWLGEQVSAWLKLRGTLLRTAIIQLLSGQAGVESPAAATFFANPIFTALKKDASSHPQYVSAQQFSSILLGMVNPPSAAPAAAAAAPADQTAAPADQTAAPADQTVVPADQAAGPAVPADQAAGPAVPAAAAAGQAAAKPSDADVLAQIQANAAAIGLGPQISALIAKANGDYQAFVTGLETWYDDHMDRVSGWYNQNLRRILLLIGFLLALIWNVDSLRIVRALSCNAAVRASVAALGDKEGSATSQALIGSVIDAVPLGWTFGRGHAPELQLSCDAINAAGVAAQPGEPQNTNAGKLDYIAYSWQWFFMKLFGLIVTAVALSLGAPFWFDALSKLTRVRQAGKKPDTGTNPSNA